MIKGALKPSLSAKDLKKQIKKLKEEEAQVGVFLKMTNDVNEIKKLKEAKEEINRRLSNFQNDLKVAETKEFRKGLGIKEDKEETNVFTDKK